MQTLVAVLALTAALGLWIAQRRRPWAAAIDPHSPNGRRPSRGPGRPSRSCASSFRPTPRRRWSRSRWATASGSREHVWARLVALGADTLTAVIVTPMLDPPARAEDGLVLPVAVLEDWHVLLPSRMRGSFTTRAQIQVCRATGQPLPRDLRGIEEWLVDV